MPTVKIRLEPFRNAETCGRCGAALDAGSVACAMTVSSVSQDPRFPDRTAYRANVRRILCAFPCADLVVGMAVLRGAPPDSYARSVAGRRMPASLRRPLLDILGRDSQFPHAPPT